MAVTWKKLAYAADVSAEIDADVATHAALTTTHGAVSAATASKIVVRDASARAKFAAPAAAGDALIKGTRVTAAELLDGTLGSPLKGGGAAVNPAYGRLDKGGMEWTLNKLLLGAGAGADPTEIDVPVTSGLAIFGDGSDGNVTVNADPFTGGPITNNSLTRDAFFNNLTVDATRTIITAGYRIFVKGTLTNNGTIARKGNNGTNPTRGAALPSGSLGGSGAGGTAVTANSGGGGSGGGIVFICAKKIINSSGVISANGGNGGNCVTTTGVGPFNSTGGAGGAATAPTAAQGGFMALPQAVLLHTLTGTLIDGGGGGGSGSYDNVAGVAGTAVSPSLGANGGAGGSLVKTTQRRASGGGGGGGCIVLIYNETTWGTETVNGGAGGTTTVAGVAGSVGRIIKIANA